MRWFLSCMACASGGKGLITLLHDHPSNLSIRSVAGYIQKSDHQGAAGKLDRLLALVQG